MPGQLRIVAGKSMTPIVHAWMKGLGDSKKMYFAINWRMPHSVFNVACKFYPGGGPALQNVDWYEIHKSKDLGTWSHGGEFIHNHFNQ